MLAENAQGTHTTHNDDDCYFLSNTPMPNEKVIGYQHSPNGNVVLVYIFFPFTIAGLLIRFLGEDLCSDVLTTVVSCFGDSELNRDLALTFLDFIFAQISSLAVPKTDV